VEQYTRPEANIETCATHGKTENNDRRCTQNEDNTANSASFQLQYQPAYSAAASSFFCPVSKSSIPPIIRFATNHFNAGYSHKVPTRRPPLQTLLPVRAPTDRSSGSDHRCIKSPSLSWHATPPRIHNASSISCVLKKNETTIYFGFLTKNKKKTKKLFFVWYAIFVFFFPSFFRIPS